MRNRVRGRDVRMVGDAYVRTPRWDEGDAVIETPPADVASYQMV
jgi:hypothetical protein